MNIKQDPSSLKMVIGWYGKDGELCEDFNLLNHTHIIKTVYQFTETGTEIASFSSEAPDYLNKFDKLECGKAYLLVLAPGSGELDVPGFVRSSYENTNLGFIKNQSSLGNTDTPSSNSTESVNGRQKEGYYYYSNNRMFKYKINYGDEMYETDYYLNDFYTLHLLSLHNLLVYYKIFDPL